VVKECELSEDNWVPEVDFVITVVLESFLKF